MVAAGSARSVGDGGVDQGGGDGAGGCFGAGVAVRPGAYPGAVAEQYQLVGECFRVLGACPLGEAEEQFVQPRLANRGRARPFLIPGLRGPHEPCRLTG